MRVNSFAGCLENYGDDWEQEDSTKRSQIIKEFPYTVVVEGAFPEHDTATQSAISNFGKKGGRWIDLWYGKTDYDYGFWEFFFKNRGDCSLFEKQVETFYADIIGLKKWKSNGSGNIVYLE